jgi:hypothetical protein
MSIAPSLLRRSAALLASLFLVACGDEEAPASPPCGDECQDGCAIRSLRETMKLVYNITLQGKPVGPQDATTPCPNGGSARVFGVASSNAEHGATEVDLTYELTACHYLQRDEDAAENYDMTLTGTVTQEGTLAVQPTATTGLVIQSDSMTFSGTIYDPPLYFEAADCAVLLGQSGNNVSGTICGREAGVNL